MTTQNDSIAEAFLADGALPVSSAAPLPANVRRLREPPPGADLRRYFVLEGEGDDYQFLQTYVRPLLGGLGCLHAAAPAWLAKAPVRRMAVEFGSTALGVVKITKSIQANQDDLVMLDLAGCLALFEDARHLHFGDRYPLGLVALLRCLRALDGRWYVMGNEIYAMLKEQGERHPYYPLIRLYASMAARYDALLATRRDTPMSYAAC